MSYNWEQFTRKIYIKSSQSKLFDYWTHAEKITNWFIKDCIYTDKEGNERQGTETYQEGDEYFWRFHQDLETSGKILKVIPNQFFSFTFGKKDQDSNEYVIVEVRFDQEDSEEASYTLKQSNMGGPELMMAEYHLSCNMGWSFFMTNMKALLEHGVDLREIDQTRAFETRALSL